MTLNRADVRLIDDVLDMAGGYVLDFSNRTFAEFFSDEFEIDIDDDQYKSGGTSKAKRLRTFLQTSEPRLAGQVLSRLVRHRVGVHGELPPAVFVKIRALVKRLEGTFAPLPLQASSSSEQAIHADNNSRTGAESRDVALSERLSELRSAAADVAKKDAMRRERVIEVGSALAEECQRASLQVRTTPFVLDQAGDEHVYGYLSASADGLQVAWRSSSEDLDDSVNKLPLEGRTYSVKEPQDWPVKWFRVITENDKLEELMEELASRITEILTPPTRVAAGNSSSDAEVAPPVASKTEQESLYRALSRLLGFLLESTEGNLFHWSKDPQHAASLGAQSKKLRAINASLAAQTYKLTPLQRKYFVEAAHQSVESLNSLGSVAFALSPDHGMIWMSITKSVSLLAELFPIHPGEDSNAPQFVIAGQDKFGLYFCELLGQLLRFDDILNTLAPLSVGRDTHSLRPVKSAVLAPGRPEIAEEMPNNSNGLFTARIKVEGVLSDSNTFRRLLKEELSIGIATAIDMSEFYLQLTSEELGRLTDAAESGTLDSIVRETGGNGLAEITVDQERLYDSVPECAPARVSLCSLPRTDIERLLQDVEVLVVTATDIERQTVLSEMNAFGNYDKLVAGAVGIPSYVIGTLGRYRTAHVTCGMGSVGRNSSFPTVSEAISEVRPKAVVLVGIAFGIDRAKQRLGDVLVAESIMNYDSVKVGETTEWRGQELTCGLTLSERFRYRRDDWTFPRRGGRVHVHQGRMLSGEKLINSRSLRDELVEEFWPVVGGEMEGAGAYAATSRQKGAEVILVKAICDWADGQKNDRAQAFAAATAVSLVKHVLGTVDVLGSLGATEDPACEQQQQAAATLKGNSLLHIEQHQTLGVEQLELLSASLEAYLATGEWQNLLRVAQEWQRSGRDLAPISLMADCYPYCGVTSKNSSSRELDVHWEGAVVVATGKSFMLFVAALVQTAAESWYQRAGQAQSDCVEVSQVDFDRVAREGSYEVGSGWSSLAATYCLGLEGGSSSGGDFSWKPPIRLLAYRGVQSDSDVGTIKKRLRSNNSIPDDCLWVLQQTAAWWERELVWPDYEQFVLAHREQPVRVIEGLGSLNGRWLHHSGGGVIRGSLDSLLLGTFNFAALRDELAALVHEVAKLEVADGETVEVSVLSHRLQIDQRKLIALAELSGSNDIGLFCSEDAQGVQIMRANSSAVPFYGVKSGEELSRRWERVAKQCQAPLNPVSSATSSDRFASLTLEVRLENAGAGYGA